MDTLIYVTILSITIDSKEYRRIRYAKTLEKAEADFKELRKVTDEEQYKGRPYKLSTYKATEIIHSEVEA